MDTKGEKETNALQQAIQLVQQTRSEIAQAEAMRQLETKLQQVERLLVEVQV